MMNLKPGFNNKMHRPCTRDFHLSLQGYDAYDGSSGCYIDDVTTFYVAPHFDPASLTPDMCKDGCASLGAEFTLAGITQGNVCLCGKDDSGDTKVARFLCFDIAIIVHFLKIKDQT